jgi:predicted Zn-dependent protease
VDSTLGVKMRHLRARIRLLQGHADGAEQDARAILRERPAYGPAVVTLGEALLQRGDVDEFDRVVAAIPDAPEAPTGRAVMRAMKALAGGDSAGALAMVDDALTRDPRSAFLQRMRAQAMGASKAEERCASLWS